MSAGASLPIPTRPLNWPNIMNSGLYPGNNFAGNPRKFLGIFPRNPRKIPRDLSQENPVKMSTVIGDFLEIFRGKILHWEIPGMNTVQWQGFGWGWRFSCDYSQEYIRTNSEEFLVTRPEEFLVNHSKEFLVTHSY